LDWRADYRPEPGTNAGLGPDLRANIAQPCNANFEVELQGIIVGKPLCVLIALLLGGCASKVMEYAAAPINDEQAKSVIEQVLMEQPQKTRPEQVVITSDYIAYGHGVMSETSGFASAVPLGNGAFAAGTSRTNSKSLVTRIYFNSIGEVTLYAKRGRWVVITRSEAGSVLNNVRVDSQVKAQRYVDSMMHFKRRL
jgi:hypothetical protein